MTSLELCRQLRERELPKFVKVLKAIPEGKRDYRPDPRSRTALELAWLLAQSEGALVSLLDSGTVEWKDTKAPTDLAPILAAFEKNSSAVDERLKKLDEMGGKVPSIYGPSADDAGQ
jgi:hypothetical protein